MKDDLATMKVGGAEVVASPSGGGAALGMGAVGVGFGLPSLAALPEAFERYPNGGEMVALLFIAWLVYRLAVTWINRPSRK
jgi:hypothetical protein